MGDDAGSSVRDLAARLLEHWPGPTGWQSMKVKDTERRSAAETLTLVTLLRRIVIGVSGGLVLIVGVAMTVLPGPAFVVVPLGLAILATEFAWAGRMMHRFRDMTNRVVANVRRQKKSPEDSPARSADRLVRSSAADSALSHPRPSSAKEPRHPLRK